MKYQIQKYKRDDSTYSDREVLAETDSVATQDQISQWEKTTLEEFDIEDSHATAVVPENHAWFIPSDNQPVLGPSDTGAVERPKAQELEGETVPNEQCLMIQRELDKKRRVEQMEKRESLAKYLADFKG